MTSYYSLLNKIEAFCDAHLQIKKYAGEFREQMPNFCTLDEKYPVVFVAPNGSLNTLNQKEFTLDIYCVDVIQKDRANLNVILSDTELILNDLYLYFSDGDDWTIDVLSTPSLQPVNNFDLDYVAGWFMTITFQVEGYCVEAIPMEPIILGGGECENASVQNSDASYSQLIASGGSLTLPDTNIRVFDELGNILWNADYPSVQNQIITVDCPDCADATINIKKEGDGTIASLTLACGSATDYYVEDNDISVNGTFITAIDATDPLDVILKDSTGATLIPSSVTHDGNQHHLNITLPSVNSALLMKTGQKASYHQWDDGDFEAGRSTDIITLSTPNPFGNTNRFTDELGGQTYTNNIVIDWSTHGENKVLGYYRIKMATSKWDTMLTTCHGLSVGSYTNGWRLWNRKELDNITHCGLNAGTANCFYWGPFTTIGGGIFWTSNTNPETSTDAYYFNSGNMNMVTLDKTITTLSGIAVRTFNVSGTTLT